MDEGAGKTWACPSWSADEVALISSTSGEGPGVAPEIVVADASETPGVEESPSTSASSTISVVSVVFCADGTGEPVNSNASSSILNG